MWQYPNFFGQFPLVFSHFLGDCTTGIPFGHHGPSGASQ